MSSIILPKGTKPTGNSEDTVTAIPGLPKYHIEKDMLIMDVPVPGAIGVYQKMVVMTKDAFVMCYNEWIKKPEEEEEV